MRKSLLIILALIAATFTARADLGGFYFEDIDIEAQVSADNVWEVTETYVINFTEERHGFYRYIPLKGHNEVEDISVDGWHFSTDESTKYNCIIRIGNAKRYVSGRQTYTISYRYVYIYPKEPDEYELYHTIFGTDFNAEVRHLTFTVNFDKPLPDDKNQGTVL